MKETPAQRSRTMRAVRSRDTSPERAVRRLLRRLGYLGYRLHRKELPGKPDVAFIGQHKAVFIHGCFWHGHDCPRGRRAPATNADYWRRKIERNLQRDAQHLAELGRLGWSVLTIWECELRDVASLSLKLIHFMAPAAIPGVTPDKRQAEVAFGRSVGRAVDSPYEDKDSPTTDGSAAADPW